MEEARADPFGTMFPPTGPESLHITNSRLSPISPDEIMNCIKTVQKRLHVDPEALNELFRFSYARARIVSALARHVYPEFPTLIEWSMLRKMMLKWHYPVKCLEVNARSVNGEPKYMAQCFKVGTLMPGSDTKALYVAVGRAKSGNVEHATRWMRLREESAYSRTGATLMQRIFNDVDSKYDQNAEASTAIDQSIWRNIGESAIGMREQFKDTADKQRKAMLDALNRTPKAETLTKQELKNIGAHF